MKIALAIIAVLAVAIFILTKGSQRGLKIRLHETLSQIIDSKMLEAEFTDSLSYFQHYRKYALKKLNAIELANGDVIFDYNVNDKIYKVTLKENSKFQPVYLVNSRNNQPQHTGHISSQTSNSPSIEYFPLSNQPDLPTNQHWNIALNAAAILVEPSLLLLSQGKPISPTRLSLEIQPKTRLMHHLHQDNPDEIAAVLRMLEIQPADSNYGLFCYHKEVNLPIGYVDTLIIEVRVYDEPKLNVQFILPFQMANDNHQFIILPLFSINNNSVSIKQLNELAQAFYKNVKNIKAPNSDETLYSLYYRDI